MRRPGPGLLAAVALSAASLGSTAAGAQGAAPDPASPALTEDTKIDFAAQAPEGKATSVPAPGSRGQEVDAGPPLRPRHTGLVLETTLGALGFAGQFRHVAPIAFWMHGQLGYEVLPWLMLFGEGELAFTDTSEAAPPSDVTAFSIWGIGGGARATVHASDRVAIFGQLSADAFAANVPHDTLAVLGYRTAESINPSYGARVGIEWYQLDRHLALGLQVGARDAQGFQRFLDGSDVPLMWDAGAGFRYTF